MASANSDLQPHPGLLEASYKAVLINLIQSAANTLRYGGSLYHWLRKPPHSPDLVKNYECRPSLSVRIFFPQSWDQESPGNLPCFFNIHGGGFCLGGPEDDDAWNRAFADMHQILVVELNYRKAPAYPFPTALFDIQALLMAAYQDESLPIDKQRIAVGGFSAGGNLSMAVCQLPLVRETIKPAAVVPMYPSLDQSVHAQDKILNRQYKPGFPGIRGSATDYLTRISPLFRWSYIPYGHPLKDPLLSPIYAPRDTFPPHIFFMAAELDQLSHEAWRMASRLANRPEPIQGQKVGQNTPSKTKGALILDDERFAFEHVGDDGRRVRWLLIPDQVHGFDLIPERMHGDPASFKDAHAKKHEFQKLLGEWLHSDAWKPSHLDSA
ncbi:Vegetative-specific protein H5 [Apiospora marii]|uniref:Vegetative-specific protein H5 n=1 Tax=Apiospora marii TaxID=335849 RepID=UPI0031311814